MQAAKVVDIAAWLRELGLERYAGAFRDNDVDPEILTKLTAEDLAAIGVTSVGNRRKLLEAIAALTVAPAKAPGAVPASAAGDAERAKDRAERRQLTVLFCDLVGSTELSARLDPEDLGEVIRAYQNRCAEVVTRWGGHVAKFMGDGVLAYFGWPRAHEDDAERAVRAGLELARAVSEQTASNGTRLTARVGIATGPVVVGDLIGEGAAQEQTVVGETPNLAARLEALAEPGSVVIAPGTRRLLGGLFDLDDLGLKPLKGFPEPVRAWRVLGAGAAESRFEALHGRHLIPLVGREEELNLLLARWRRAADGEGQVVLLSGEPGIGKSRIVQALREQLIGERYTALSHYCSSYHTASALYPVIGLLERAAGFSRDDPPEARLDKLQALLAQGTERLVEAVPLIADVLGIVAGERYPSPNLSPQRQAQRTLEVLIEQVEGLALRQPVLALYEDVHWIDPSTLDLLELVIERVRQLPVLVLITFRPEFQPPWTAHANVTTLTMSRLGRRQGADLVARVTDEKPLPAEIVEQIVARTDGVPLFVEELTKTVLESGLLTDAGDHYELAGPLPPLAIPATLHDSLMARLDRLAPVKELAQTAAVIGRAFSYDVLAAVSPLSGPDLNVALDQLVASELVFRHGSPPDATYSFKHALVQDAAYQSLLKSRRQQLHARIAHILQERFPGLAATQPEVLAHHLTEAGLRKQAVDYWYKAGERATERFANPEAIKHFEEALKLLEVYPAGEQREQQELRFRIALNVPLIAVNGFGSEEVEHCARRARDLSERLGHAKHRFAATRALWNSRLMRRSVPEALALSLELQQLGEEADDPAQLAIAHRSHGFSLLMAGRLSAAREELGRGIQLADRVPDATRFWVYGEHPAMVCRAYLAKTLALLGQSDRAASLADEAVAVARRLENPHTLAWSLVIAANVRVFCRQAEATRVRADEVIRLAHEHRLPQWLAGATVFHGFALAEAGDLENAVAEMETGVARWHGTGALLQSTLYHGLTAAVCGAFGDLRRSREHLAIALAHVNDFGECYLEAELYRLKASLRRQEGAPPGAIEAAVRHAMEIAEAQGARLWHLRAATSLARLWAEQGKRTQAHDLLEPVYDSFTEGFDTADLKDAKALLDALA